MKKRVNNVKKEDKYKEFDLNKLRKAEMIISLIVGIIFLVLLGFAVTNTVFFIVHFPFYKSLNRP